jgi:peptidoglycan/LPS O-acetylase OafA/YrhL
MLIAGYHFAPPSIKTSVWLFSKGQEAVTFFFLLSGYFLHISSKAPIGARDLFKSKLKAVLPLYYSTLLACILIELLNGRTPWITFVLDALLLQAWVPGEQTSINSPAWFMSALMACVVLYVFCLRRCVTPLTAVRFMFISLSFWLFSQFSLCWLIEFIPEPAPYFLTYFPLSHLSSFLLGVAVSKLHDEKFPRNLSLGRSLGLCITSILFWLYALKEINQFPETLARLAQVGLLAPLSGMLIFSIATIPHAVLMHFDRAYIRFFGAIAFPIFLFQVPVFKTIERTSIYFGLLQSKPEYFFISFMVLLLIASCFWLIIQPFMFKILSCSLFYR